MGTSGAIPPPDSTMEFDLSKESLPRMSPFDDSCKPMVAATKEKNSVFLTWEENYQDLSGWCIDAFQGECDIPINEFDANKYSGTKNKDDDVSSKGTEENGEESRGPPLADRESSENSTRKMLELSQGESGERSREGNKRFAIKSEAIYPDQRTGDFFRLDKKYNLTKRDESADIVSAECSNLIPREIAKDGNEERSPLDEFDETEPETFDLLSYLCNDNIKWPDDGIVSRDSDITIESNSSIASRSDVVAVASVAVSSSSVSRKGRSDRIARRVERVEAKPSSSLTTIAAISAALDSVAKMSERRTAMRNKQICNSKVTRNAYDDSNFGKKRGKKHNADADLDKSPPNEIYLESREKNNVASRKSRWNKKAKEMEMIIRADELEKDNRILKMKVNELDKLVVSMRTAIFESVLKNRS